MFAFLRSATKRRLDALLSPQAAIEFDLDDTVLRANANFLRPTCSR